MSGLLATVENVRAFDSTATVYNFEVENTHNYYVGAKGVLVHNDCASLLAYLRDVKNNLKALETKFTDGRVFDDVLSSKFVANFEGNDAWLAAINKALTNNNNVISVWKQIDEKLINKIISSSNISPSYLEAVTALFPSAPGRAATLLEEIYKERYIGKLVLSVTDINSDIGFLWHIVDTRSAIGGLKMINPLPPSISAVANSYYTNRTQVSLTFADWIETVLRAKGVFQVHHIVPISVLERNEKLQKLLLWAEKNGRTFDFNGIDNAIPLTIAHHGGSHPEYIRKVNDILNQNLSGSMDVQFSELQSFVSKLRTKIHTEMVTPNSTNSIENLNIVW